MTPPLSAVNDTTILVSGVVASTGPIADLMDAVVSGDVERVLSPYILEELRRTLATKRYFQDRVTAEEREVYVSRLEAVATLMVPHQALSGVVADPQDDPIIALAVSA